MTEIRKIKFRGHDFILVYGAITSEAAYKRGACSFAHLHPSGAISRFGTLIGTRADIEFGEEIDVKQNKDAFFNMFAGVGGWPWGEKAAHGNSSPQKNSRRGAMTAIKWILFGIVVGAFLFLYLTG